MVIREYTHLKVEDDVQCIAGHYTLLKEARIEYKSRQVLYTIVHFVVDSSCCGAGRRQHALVYGYILNWQLRANQDGFPVTEVEPITAPEDRENVRRIIEKTEFVSVVEFR